MKLDKFDIYMYMLKNNIIHCSSRNTIVCTNIQNSRALYKLIHIISYMIYLHISLSGVLPMTQELSNELKYSSKNKKLIASVLRLRVLRRRPIL